MATMLAHGEGRMVKYVQFSELSAEEKIHLMVRRNLMYISLSLPIVFVIYVFSLLLGVSYPFSPEIMIPLMIAPIAVLIFLVDLRYGHTWAYAGWVKADNGSTLKQGD